MDVNLFFTTLHIFSVIVQGIPRLVGTILYNVKKKTCNCIIVCVNLGNCPASFNQV